MTHATFTGPHDWPLFQDWVMCYGVPVHPTAPMSYDLWLRAVVTAQRDRCGCVTCYDVAVPSRR
jgi:hypothetical protein